jgi:CDP-diacylglycerol--glycerol-3-phosphate 3-phosphatidyltransferase
LSVPAPVGSYIGLAIFAVASLTDLVDGHIARSRDQSPISEKFMDPLATRSLLAALVWFTEQGLIPAWATLVVVVRELAVTVSGSVPPTGARVIAAGTSGAR